MIDLTKYQYIDNEVTIICNDGDELTGRISAVEDEEESGLNEIGIALFCNDGRYIGIGQSEIKEIIIHE